MKISNHIWQESKITANGEEKKKKETYGGGELISHTTNEMQPIVYDVHTPSAHGA